MAAPARQPRLPLERQVPADSVASPTQMRETGLAEMWYLPGWGETARLLGWRWVLVLPAALLAVALLMLPLRPWWLQHLVIWWKPVVFAVAIPLGVMVKQAKDVIRARKDPFCIHCGYGLTGLPDGHTCPECGRPFTFALVEEYRRDPHWFIERYRSRHLIPPACTPFDAGPVRRRTRSRDGT